MRRFLLALALGSIGFVAPASALAQETAPEPVDAALQSLKAIAEGAAAERSVDALLPHLHPDVVVTWPNAQVSRGREGVAEFFFQTFESEDAQLAGYATSITIDDVTLSDSGRTAVAWGSAADVYSMGDGTALQMSTRWSATLVASEDAWQVAAFTGTIDPFDNAIVGAAKQLIVHIGLGSLVLGGIIGFTIGRRGRRDGA